MDPREFYRNVQEHQDLEWLGSKKGETPAEDEVFIANEKQHVKFSVTVQGILGASWRELLGVLECTREPVVMKQLTRIVGYYAFIQNFNRSKVAEVKDRRKGNYGVPEAAHVEEEPRKSKTEPAPARQPAGV